MNRYQHTLTRFADGRLDGDAQCSWSGDVERVEWQSKDTGRRLPKPRTADEIDRRFAMCSACGHTIPLEGVEP